MAEVRGDGQEQGSTIGNDRPEASSDHEDQGELHGEELETIVAIAELLEVALHTILCMRQVYPIEIFERRVKLGIPVFQCVEPSINGYISEVIKAIAEELAEDRIARVTISIHQSEMPLEKFIFTFCSKGDGVSIPRADNLPIQRQARGMLIKLNAIDAQLLPLEESDDLSFSVVMQLRDETSFRISEDELNFGETGKDVLERSPTPSALQEPSLVHIIRSGRLSVYLHVQESEAKEQEHPSVPSDEKDGGPGKNGRG